ncbi:MAG TPA: hypothetical protein VMV22_13750 [Acidimicrobiales bacterium]|nr:hypothetical protein [Acidimicrobiales bacterium]
MWRRHQGARGRRRIAAGATVAVAWGVLVSFTHPFTWAADVVTAVPLAVVVVATVLRVRAPRLGDAAGPAGVTATDPAHACPRGRRGAVWPALAAAVGGWELYCYASAPRAAHPTLSTLVDLLDASRAGKIVAVAAWLGFGAYLVAR